ncbi:P-loop NTPase fold protein [Streptomyces sp. NPDC097619]|uniref:P-loop NTPase fold protein n=1 Tax=Streptomyces sp. NPDC097619 TaxID=3157228 RepID=UPI003318EC14
MPRTRPRHAWQVADCFTLEREAQVYVEVVDACLEEPEVARRLGIRPRATAENARAMMLTEANIRRALEPTRDAQARFRTLREKGERLQRRLDYLHEVPHPATQILWVSLVMAFVLVVLAPWATLPFVLLVPAAIVIAVLRHPVLRLNARLNFREAVLRPRVALQTRRIRWAEAAWTRGLQEHGVRQLLSRVVDALLGDDPDSLLLPDNYDGLRSARDPRYVVDSPVARRLFDKMTQLEGGGTIAVSGPRGAGKSTLLRACADKADLAVVMQAPATYSPYEFLVSLCVRTCETYLERCDQVPPAFVRLSPFRRAARALLPLLRKRVPPLLLGLAATALIVFGTAGSTRAFWGRHEISVRVRVEDALDRVLAEPLLDVWHGERAGMALLLALVGVLLWWLRGWKGRPKIRPMAARVVRAVGALIALVSIATLAFDDRTKSVLADDVALLVLVTTPLLLGLMYLSDILEPLERFVAPAVLVLWLALSVTRPAIREFAADPDHPARLVGILAGLLLYRAASRRPAPRSHLVSVCRDELYRLRTLQTSSSGLTAGAPQLLTAYTSSLSSLPPNFPELVGDYRKLLKEIADERHALGGRVLIAIDELDRLGSDAQALEFLNEIKGVLGVPHVHYLLSVAEDVGATFVRRGLPHRGVADSYLDDVVHVPPRTLDESREILERRAPGLREPFKALTHALSGGVTRDLIRYGLRVDDIDTRTGYVELADIARQLIQEELAETLSGFRTLLGKERWTPRSSTALVTFGDLVGRLPLPCPCVSPELRSVLERVAFHDLGRQLGEDAASEVPDPARELMDEASVYVLFSLTLLEIFGTVDFERRRGEAAARGRAGELEHLGRARQELEISPYSARLLIMSIREAWSLPDDRAVHALAIPEPRPGACPGHPRNQQSR